ncbi:MAG TPA: YebC/PmpR family DNA-binding transcriptional regulator, partial [Patescibacteria group bacterium]
FTQLAKLIRSAVKENGSGDPNSNPSLRLILDKARAANMPKENIQRAIDKGLGKSSTGQAYQEFLYEGFGPQGVGLLIEVVTDNPNRTSSEVRTLLSKAGGSLAGPRSVSYLFQRNQAGEYEPTIPMPADDEVKEKLAELIENLEELDDVEAVYTNGG